MIQKKIQSKSVTKKPTTKKTKKKIVTKKESIVKSKPKVKSKPVTKKVAKKVIEVLKEIKVKKEKPSYFKPLPYSKTKNGFIYTLVKREDKVAMYQQHNKAGELVAFEVFSITTHNGYEIAGKIIPPAELFPSNEMFGVTAWSFRDREGALIKFKELFTKQESLLSLKV